MKYLAVALLVVVLTVSGALGLARSSPDSPAVGAVSTAGTGPGADAGTGTAAAPAPGSQDLSGAIVTLQERVRRLPDDPTGWATLALTYVEQARVGGNPAYYDKADQAVSRSLAVTPADNAPAHAAAAALAAARHHFARALREADTALAVDPYDPGALAIRVDALTELGRYRDQLHALEVADRRAPGISIAARYSYAYELRGDLSRAVAILRRAAASGSHADKAYLLTLTADLDRREGRLPAAARHLRTALVESPGYLPALASQARLAVAQGRLGLALHRWQYVVATSRLAEYSTELGELYLHLGRPAAARRQFHAVEATERLEAANGVDTYLDTATLAADHGDSAAALGDARAEWQRRRSLHVADVLGWALHGEGRNRSALRYAKRATRLGTEEARLWLHRGIIEAALGRRAAAVRHLRHGLAVDPGVGPWQADRAERTLRSLGVRR